MTINNKIKWFCASIVINLDRQWFDISDNNYYVYYHRLAWILFEMYKGHRAITPHTLKCTNRDYKNFKEKCNLDFSLNRNDRIELISHGESLPKESIYKASMIITFDAKTKHIQIIKNRYF